jgi:hypothetical protein
LEILRSLRSLRMTEEMISAELSRPELTALDLGGL